jgi:hypothetical protein
MTVSRIAAIVPNALKACAGAFCQQPKILVSPLDPHLPIGIQQDIFRAVILKAGGNQRPEFPYQFFISSFGDLLKFVHLFPPILATIQILIYRSV